MSSFNKYKILKEQKLIILFHQGNLSEKGFKLNRYKVINDKDFHTSYNFILDIRHSKIKMTIDGVIKFGLWLSKNRILNKESLRVILTNTPSHVVFSTLFRDSKGVDIFGYNIFSSLRHSLNYLEVDKKDFNLVEGEIEKMIEK
jgi:hypothetical protein